MYLLSSLDNIDVRFELISDDVWEAEDDKQISWVLEWIISIDCFWKRPNSSPMVKNGSKNQKYDKWR